MGSSSHRRLHIAKTITWCVGGFGVLVLGAFTIPAIVRHVRSVEADEAQLATFQLTIHPQSAFRGQRVDILEGEVPLIEFMRFLSDYTGATVAVECGEFGKASLMDPIFIAAQINDADARFVTAILEANRWVVFRERLPSGKEYISIKWAYGQKTHPASR